MHLNPNFYCCSSFVLSWPDKVPLEKASWWVSPKVIALSTLQLTQLADQVKKILFS